MNANASFLFWVVNKDKFTGNIWRICTFDDTKIKFGTKSEYVINSAIYGYCRFEDKKKEHHNLYSLWDLLKFPKHAIQKTCTVFHPIRRLRFRGLIIYPQF